MPPESRRPAWGAPSRCVRSWSASPLVDEVFRDEWGRVLATLVGDFGDFDLAEEATQDAFAVAAERWPRDGMPDNPGAWLTQAAKHRAIDYLRRGTRIGRKHEEIGRELAELEMTPPDLDSALDDHVGDDLLRLVFVSCHPVLSTEGRVALTLRLLGGLTTQEIARAFLAGEATIQQRIVRAKRTLSEANVAFEVPRGDELVARIASVLEVIYLIFNEGYSATAGDDWMRPALCEEALRLGRILAELTPHEPEVHGLVALMEIQASRLKARVGPTGEPILLMDQNRARWDQLLINRGFAGLLRAEREASAKGGTLGPYALQAAIAACHARARVGTETDWARIATLYQSLAIISPSPVIELNRAVAVGMAHGAAEGLKIVDAIAADPTVKNYYVLPTVRGDLLEKLGRLDEARAEFERAVSLTRNVREQAVLRGRAAALNKH